MGPRGFTALCLEADGTTLHSSVLFIKIHLNVILPSITRSSKWPVNWWK